MTQAIRRKKLDGYLAASLCGNFKQPTKFLGPLEARFDYLVFVGDVYPKQLSFDLADVYYPSRYARIEKDLLHIQLLRDRLAGATLPQASSRARSPGKTEPLAADRALRQLAQMESEDRPARSAPASDSQHSPDTWAQDRWPRADTSPAHLEDSEAAHFLLTFRVLRATGLLNLSKRFSPKALVAVKPDPLLEEALLQKSRVFGASVGPLTPALLTQLLTAASDSRSSSPTFQHEAAFQLPAIAFLKQLQRLDVVVYHADGQAKPLLLGAASVALDWKGFAEECEACEDRVTVPLEAAFGDLESGEALVQFEVSLCRRKSGPSALPEEEPAAQAGLLSREQPAQLFESVENPFQRGMKYTEEDPDRGRPCSPDSLSRTKKTLEELKKLAPGLEDRDLLSSQLAIEQLKNTLSSSEMHRMGRSSSGKPSRPKTSEGRPSHSVPEGLAESQEPLRTGLRDLHSAGLSGKEPRAEEEPEEPAIFFEDHKSPALRPSLNMNSDPSFGFRESQPRNTPAFLEPAAVAEVEPEKELSENPFKQHSLAPDFFPRARRDPSESPEEDSPRPRFPQNRRLLSNLKSRLGESQLKEEDLERIQRIFQNRKLEQRRFDIDDSDTDNL